MTMLARIIGMLMLLSLILTVNPAAATMLMWDVEYFLRGDPSTLTVFYTAGEIAYEFYLYPDYIVVQRSLNDPVPGNHAMWLGYYGQIVLPEGMPAIVFPLGMDGAIVRLVPVNCGGKKHEKPRDR